jgi:hypothetical protein
MKKSIRDKENELRKKWSYIKELSKDDNIKKETTFELMEAEDELFKKWKFFKGYLNAKENTNDRKDKENIRKNCNH